MRGRRAAARSTSSSSASPAASQAGARWRPRFGVGGATAPVISPSSGDVQQLGRSRQAVRLFGLDVGGERSDRRSRVGQADQAGLRLPDCAARGVWPRVCRWTCTSLTPGRSSVRSRCDSGILGIGRRDDVRSLVPRTCPHVFTTSPRTTTKSASAFVSRSRSSRSRSARLTACRAAAACGEFATRCRPRGSLPSAVGPAHRRPMRTISSSCQHHPVRRNDAVR